VIFEPLVADVADVALDFALAVGILLRHDVVPGSAVQEVDDVVKLQLVQGQLCRTPRFTDILGKTKTITKSCKNSKVTKK
jgi:hypothetical protein